jgi:hypothetical protein
MEIAQIENVYINYKKAIKMTSDIDNLKGFHLILLEKMPAGNKQEYERRATPSDYSRLNYISTSSMQAVPGAAMYFQDTQPLINKTSCDPLGLA